MRANPEGESCSKCWYYFEVGAGGGIHQGLCKRFPPNLSAPAHLDAKSDDQPVVVGEGWCGEFKDHQGGGKC